MAPVAHCWQASGSSKISGGAWKYFMVPGLSGKGWKGLQPRASNWGMFWASPLR